MISENLFDGIPEESADELVDILAKNKHVRVKRIVSIGHTSPDGFWYDCADAEWVAVLCGEATLLFEGDPDPLHLRAGDHVAIASHQRHRVEWTTPNEPTVWLAVYFKAADRPIAADQ